MESEAGKCDGRRTDPDAPNNPTAGGGGSKPEGLANMKGPAQPLVDAGSAEQPANKSDKRKQ